MNLSHIIAGTEEPSRPYIIAEIGVNHECDMEKAFQMIDECREFGAHAVKFQAYKAGTIASKHSPSYWDTTKEPTTSQYQLFQKYDKFGQAEFEQLKAYSDQRGVDFLCTPFDIASADYLAPMMDTIKISSSDLTNKPFIEYLCGFGKPIILSTGASDEAEIREAVSWIAKFDLPLCLMHCVLNYPTPNDRAQLARITGLKEAFPEWVIGYSDHTLPEDMSTLQYAWALGAKVIEKHYTFDKSLPGNDHYHAMDKDDLILFEKRLAESVSMEEISRSEKYGNKALVFSPDEVLSRQNARRSLVLACDLEQGEVLSREHLTWKRPASGVSPAEIDRVLGQVVNRSLKADDVLMWEHLS
ncbi:MAG: acetylneuraminic acid synthetase [Oleiphilus sp.]|nr:MAG: acetylneuraminic acid synthetase [Oleiphilus sp.]